MVLSRSRYHLGERAREATFLPLLGEVRVRVGVRLKATSSLGAFCLA